MPSSQLDFQNGTAKNTAARKKTVKIMKKCRQETLNIRKKWSDRVLRLYLQCLT